MEISNHGEPCRNDIERQTPAESLITEAMRILNKSGRHRLLTEAFVLLSDAREKVANFADLGPENSSEENSYIPGEPLHARGGMICLDPGHYFQAVRVEEVTCISADVCRVTVSNVDDCFDVHCTLPDFLDAMERAQERADGVHVSTVHGDATYTINETTG